MNPNTCTICELMFERVMKARNVEIEATVLFADLRGYTAASQVLSSDHMTTFSILFTMNARTLFGSTMDCLTRLSAMP